MAVSQERKAMLWGSDPGLLSNNFLSMSAQLPSFVHTCFPRQGQERLTGSKERMKGRQELLSEFDVLVYHSAWTTTRSVPVSPLTSAHSAD